MEGVFIGDLVGSAYEWTGFKSKEFPLFSAKCRGTDDSLMTCAVAEAFAKAQQEGRLGEDAYVEGLLAHFMRNIGLRYPDAGYGSKFLYWLQHKELGPYGSFGNGAAMRVAPAAYFGRTLEEVEHLAMVSARVSHNHPSAYKAAKAVAGCAFLARKGADKDGLGAYAGRYYNLHFTVEGIRDSYRGDSSCDNSVPQGIVSFLDADSFEDGLRNAVSLGGDSDTLAAIAGAIGEPFFGIPPLLVVEARKYYLPELKKWENA